MSKFPIHMSILSIKEQYPDSKSLKEALENSDQSSRRAVARLWISEGIPKVFSESPSIYESLREWLGRHLEVHPKHISITGSARLGYSLASNKFGQEFTDDSDLDLFIVSENLFERLKTDFFLWVDKYDKNLIAPKGKALKYWPSNKEIGIKNIKRGFVDSNKIPSHKDYTTNKQVLQTMFLLIKKLEEIDSVPSPRKASIRCYMDWDSAINQISLNLYYLSQFNSCSPTATTGSHSRTAPRR